MVNENDWKEIGVLSKKIRNDLIELKNKSQEMKMRKKEVHSIMRALGYLDKYRSDAENLMFSKGIRDLKIFYGSDSK
ncbi:hypothetical protein COC69_01245 [Bacillus cereus]|uniref:Uncharacterized protein n=1 Tax=Bacillus cereus TaxID=1396 RepID=A0A9X7GY68_BACCE|nr:hypothetical protein [Bacillus cereus]PGS83966.1 hypothetical protein COC69_01245 [Bacillus cereus]